MTSLQPGGGERQVRRGSPRDGTAEGFGACVVPDAPGRALPAIPDALASSGSPRYGRDDELLEAMTFGGLVPRTRGSRAPNDAITGRAYRTRAASVVRCARFAAGPTRAGADAMAPSHRLARSNRRRIRRSVALAGGSARGATSAEVHRPACGMGCLWTVVRPGTTKDAEGGLTAAHRRLA